MYSSALSRTSALDVVGVQPNVPAASTPGIELEPNLQQAEWAQGRSGRAE